MYINRVKRILDLIISFTLFPFWIIILLVLGPIIYLQDKGNIFYNSSRLGQDGVIFKMYKFRSMKINSADYRNLDGSTFNSEDDLRLTRIGKVIRKTSLDETPQLLNVIKGDMSIVGPRPDLPEHLELYKGNEVEKLDVKPGITGYNQAYYRNTVPWKKRIQNDVYYVKNLSFKFDIKIMLETLKSVTKAKNIYNR